MKDFLDVLINMSISGAFIALVIMLLRIPLKKAPRRYSYMLWAILGIRLLCPVSLPSPVSLFNLFRAETSGGRMTFNVTETTPVTITPAANTAVPAVGQDIPQQSAATGGSTNSVLFWIWAAGAVIFAVYMLVSFMRLRRLISGARRVSDNIYECEGLPTAFVMGLVRPRIYLPAGLSGKDRDFIIAHEKTHIRRLDFLVKPLAILALGIHWFNPLVWVSFFLMVRDMEISCDERAVHDFSVRERKEYAAALLNMSIRQNRLTGVLAFGESSIKQRIKNVLSPKKPTLWISIAAVILIIAASVCLLTNSDKQPDTSSADVSASQPDISSDTSSQPETSDVSRTETVESTSTPDVSSQPPAEVSQTVLNETNAVETVNAILSSFRSEETSTGFLTISFDIPNQLPTDPEGKTKLYITVNADYYLGEGTYSSERLIDFKEYGAGGSWVGVIATPDDTRELQGVMLRAAFMTAVDGESQTYTEYYADYIQPSGEDLLSGVYDIAPARVEITDTTLHYYFSGDDWTIKLGYLPAGLTLSAGADHSAGIPEAAILKNGAQVGTINMYSFGTTQPDELAQIDTASDTLPMQIYSPIALSSMVDYANGYKVVINTATGSIAVANPVSGNGAETQAVYAFDYSKIPYFVMMSFDNGTVSEKELESIALDIQING